MPVFSPRAVASIESFAASMGLAARPARDGSYGFRFTHSGLLSLTPADDGARAMMSLAWIPSRVDRATERRLLATAGIDPTSGRFLQTGMASDGTFVCAVALDEANLDLPTIDFWLRRLLDLREGFG